EAKLYLETGNRTAADRALRSGIAAFERLRPPTSAVAEASYMNHSWDLFARTIDMTAADGDEQIALDAAELARARPGDGRTLEWAGAQIRELARALPPKTAALYYVPLGERLLIWRITSAGQRMFVVETSEGDLTTSIDRFARALQQPDGPDWRAWASRLYGQIVQPVLVGLPAAGRLVVIAGGSIGR